MSTTAKHTTRSRTSHPYSRQHRWMHNPSRYRNPPGTVVCRGNSNPGLDVKRPVLPHDLKTHRYLLDFLYGDDPEKCAKFHARTPTYMALWMSELDYIYRYQPELRGSMKHHHFDLEQKKMVEGRRVER